MEHKSMYTLEGVDGNALAIMAYVKDSMTKENRPRTEIDAYLKEAQSQDYQHLLAVSAAAIDALNEQKQ